MIRSRIIGPMVLFIMFIVLMMSTMLGVNHGLKASSAEDAEIVRGEDYNLSDDPKPGEKLNATVDPLPLVPDPWQPEFLGPYSAEDANQIDGVDRFVHFVVHGSMRYASVVSVFTYKNQWWIKEWWVGPLIQLVSYSGIAGFIGYVGLQYLSQAQAVVNS